MKRFVTQALAVGIAVFGVNAGAAVLVYRPADDSEVVLRLDNQSRMASAKRLTQISALAQSDVEAYVAQVDNLLDAGVSSGNERYYGYAEQAMKDAPASLTDRLATRRARVLQHRHDFRGAAAILDPAIAHNPRDRAARLLRAQIRIHLLDGNGAMQDCTALASLADLGTTTVCVAQARAARGDLSGAFRMLTATLDSQPLDPVTRSWGAGIAAEVAARSGDTANADRWYREAYALDRTSHYPRVALADWLLVQGKFDEARSVAISGSAPADQLRVALAEQKRDSRLTEQLQLAWNEATARGERGHLRDQARFELKVLRDVARAHATARDNFTDRQEPEDALLLAETATLAHDERSLELVRRWQAQHAYRDVRLDD
jgi:tetratricopeptide (TPR) repeat protein